MNVIIKPVEALNGEVEAPPSKSYTHRMLVAALLSSGKTVIEKPSISDDTLATLEAIKSFGACVEQKGDSWEVDGQPHLKTPEKSVNCRESGTTLRFMIPVAALAPGKTKFILGSSLSNRPIKPLLQSLRMLGVKTRHNRSFVVVYGGGINGGKTTVRGDISSQFISGLLFAGPRAKKDTEIDITQPIGSKGYIEMTAEVLRRHSVEVKISEDYSHIKIPSGQSYKPFRHKVPGDFSSAAYLLAAAAITSSKIRVYNLDCASKQGDRTILEILRQAGINVYFGENFVEVQGAISSPIKVDADDIPDLVPPCAAIACYAAGKSEIRNAERLRYKESDRLEALYSEFRKMGADISVEGGKLTIRGPCKLHGAVIDPHNDHRIAMACAVAALGAKGDSTIMNAECVSKSYPKFFKDLSLLGANVIGGGELVW
ncbi:MAG: 3-phosphoshikimate 1-carboxyvinyltransferase [Candidatus Bathyarchaeota archaeon]|nr:3-phosphoshikimate 1-carboxyvinyltransferase [Candidatus Bathyarchaeota archaeon]MDW8023465.1 3-phosphoshikimate 1-carboxyvinyltransferase [Nitrososphaerota archaeon]MDW8041099.1 3-phosphoshikimate 1-carboxyvinyltransferase [Nitrososphaerota archaeon]